MKHRFFSTGFIAVSIAAVYFSQDFVFLKNYLKISPPLVVILAGLTFLICLRFNKSRVAFMLALLLAWFFRKMVPGLADIPENEFRVILSLNVLYIVNAGERGVFSIHGLRKAGIIVVQFALLYYFTVYNTAFYQASDKPIIRYLHLFIDLPYAGLPLLLLSLAAVLRPWGGFRAYRPGRMGKRHYGVKHDGCLPDDIYWHPFFHLHHFLRG